MTTTLSSDPRITLHHSATEAPHPHAGPTKWQVIFKTAEGKDYCRESYGTGYYRDVGAIVAKVGRELDTYGRSVASARIERW